MEYPLLLGLMCQKLFLRIGFFRNCVKMDCVIFLQTLINS